MKISVSIKEQACERLLHFHPKKTIARELGISASVVRDWSFFVNKGDFAWISERSVLTRKAQHHQAILYWIEHYPIGYSDVARLFGIRPSDLYTKIKRYIARSPSQCLPAKIRLWDCLRWHGTGDAMVDKAKIAQMVSERLSKAKTKEQLDKEVNDILITYECLFQELLSDCKDEVKKKRVAAISRAAQAGVSIKAACQVLRVPRSSYYATKHPSESRRRDEQKAQWIAQIQQACFYTIGRRRMGVLLEQAKGLKLGQSQIGRLMKAFQLNAKIRQQRKTYQKSLRVQTQGLATNVLNRDFSSTCPRSKLVADVTYVPYYEDNQWHWGYLSLILDLYDRSIVAWCYGKQHNQQLALKTLKILSFKGVAPHALLHSDHGSIYTSQAFREELARQGIKQSLSRVGNCHDNAVMESFNGILKVEGLYNEAFSTASTPSFIEQNQAIERFIAFYHHRRPSSVLNNQTPMAFNQPSRLTPMVY